MIYLGRKTQAARTELLTAEGLAVALSGSSPGQHSSKRPSMRAAPAPISQDDDGDGDAGKARKYRQQQHGGHRVTGLVGPREATSDRDCNRPGNLTFCPDR